MIMTIFFLTAPPGISLISENVFNASDIILVPLIPTTLSVRSYIKLLKFFKKNKMNNSKIYPFFSMVEKRKSLHIDTINRIGKKKNNFLTTQIPYRSDIEKMGIEKRPVPEYAENSPASESYFSLWEEINSL